MYFCSNQLIVGFEGLLRSVSVGATLMNRSTEEPKAVEDVRTLPIVTNVKNSMLQSIAFWSTI